MTNISKKLYCEIFMIHNAPYTFHPLESNTLQISAIHFCWCSAEWNKSCLLSPHQLLVWFSHFLHGPLLQRFPSILPNIVCFISLSYRSFNRYDRIATDVIFLIMIYFSFDILFRICSIPLVSLQLIFRTTLIAFHFGSQYLSFIGFCKGSYF